MEAVNNWGELGQWQFVVARSVAAARSAIERLPLHPEFSALRQTQLVARSSRGPDAGRPYSVKGHVRAKIENAKRLKMVPLKIRPPVPPSALRVLRDVPNIDAVIVDEAGRPTVAVEFKSQVAAPDARMLAARFESSRPPISLWWSRTRPLSPRGQSSKRPVLVSLMVSAMPHSWSSRAWQIHVEKPTRRARARPAGMRISGKTAVVVQALLREPERDWKLTDLAKRAEVSAGTAHRVVRNLEDRSFWSEREGVPSAAGASTTPGRCSTFLPRSSRSRLPVFHGLPVRAGRTASAQRGRPGACPAGHWIRDLRRSRGEHSRPIPNHCAPGRHLDIGLRFPSRVQRRRSVGRRRSAAQTGR